MSSLVAKVRGAVFTPVALASPLAPQECLRRLAAITAPVFSFMKSRTTFPLAGSVTPAAVSLRYRISYRNDYLRGLVGRIEPAGEGSVLRGVLRPSIAAGLIASIFSVAALGFQAVLLAGLFSGAAKLQGTGDDLLYFIPTLMLLVLVGSFIFGLWLSRSAERKLVEILQAEMKTELISGTPPPPAGATIAGAPGSIEPR